MCAFLNHARLVYNFLRIDIELTSSVVSEMVTGDHL